MSTKLANYSPERVNVVLALMHTVTGFVDGTFITIEKDSPVFTVSESSDGVVSRSMSSSMLYTVRLTLGQYSESNSVLTTMLALDLGTKGRAKFPMTIKDSSGTSTMFAAEAWVTSLPPTTYSAGVEVREWEIKCASSINFVGNNYEESSTLGDFAKIAAGYGLSVL